MKPQKDKLLENKERNRVLALAVFMIIALSVVSLWQRGVTTPANKAPTFSSEKEQVAAAVKSNPVANDQIMKSIVDEKQMATELAKRLKVNQNVAPVQIADSKLNIEANSPENITAYFSSIIALGNDYNQKVTPILTDFWNDNATQDQLDQGYAYTQDMINSLYALQVPKDAAAFHKDAINLYMANDDIFSKGKYLQQQDGTNNNVDVWQYVYKAYATSQLVSDDMDKQYSSLKQKYNLPW